MITIILTNYIDSSSFDGINKPIGVFIRDEIMIRYGERIHLSLWFDVLLLGIGGNIPLS